MIIAKNWGADSGETKNVPKGIVLRALKKCGFTLTEDNEARYDKMCQLEKDWCMNCDDDYDDRDEAMELAEDIKDFRFMYTRILKLFTRTDDEIGAIDNDEYGDLEVVDSNQLKGYREIDISCGNLADDYADFVDDYCVGQDEKLIRDFYIHLIEDSDPAAVYCSKKSRNPKRVARLPKKVEVVVADDKIVGFATDDNRFISIA